MSYLLSSWMKISYCSLHGWKYHICSLHGWKYRNCSLYGWKYHNCSLHGWKYDILILLMVGIKCKKLKSLVANLHTTLVLHTTYLFTRCSIWAIVLLFANVNFALHIERFCQDLFFNQQSICFDIFKKSVIKKIVLISNDFWDF